MIRFLALAFAFVILATGAAAHSKLEASIPAKDAVIAAAPTELALTFKQDIRLTRVALVIGDQDPVALELGEQTNFATEYVLPIIDQASGVYVIEWRGLGADGHPLKGTFSFTVE